MIAPICQHEQRRKRGTDRKGNQRYQCKSCGVTFTSEENRPLGDMRIDLDDACRVLNMLLEGMSIRACERMTGMNRDTICDLVVLAGENCDKFLRETVTGVEAKTIEMDEMWGFVGCKEKTREAKGYDTDKGDAWTWLAIDADTKMILSHAVGQRDDATAREFLTRLNDATTGKCQVTSDGLRAYTHNVPLLMGSRVDYAQLVKSYKSTQTQTRYSPAKITGAEKISRFGNPDMDKVSTSYSERLNLSVRMHVRRFTRLTNAHSKSVRHHAAMTSLFTAWYNFCRTHSSLAKKTTPAMAAGLRSGFGLLGICCEKQLSPLVGGLSR